MGKRGGLEAEMGNDWNEERKEKSPKLQLREDAQGGREASGCPGTGEVDREEREEGKKKDSSK